MTDTEAAPAAEARPAGPVLRFIGPVLAAALTTGSLGWAGDIYRDIGIVMLTEQFLAAMLGIALALVYIYYPPVRGSSRDTVPWYDLALSAIGLFCGFYVSYHYQDLIDRLIDAPWDAVLLSIVLVVLCIEGLRRTVGYALVIIVLFFMFFALIGHMMPGDLETIEVQPAAFIGYIGLDTSSLLGLAMIVGMTIVMPFVYFGQLLLRSGGSNFFNDISLILMGRYRGGSAKIAVMASSLFGSVSGVAVSNIVATGVITIPMMKRSGFSPRFSASVEAVASTGGQLMPPVMGAVAFLMADFLERPYRDIVVAALVPSILYYVALFIQVDFEAAKNGIKRVPAIDIPAATAVLKTGSFYLLPFVALIYALFWLNWRPETAALGACAVVFLVGLIIGYQGQRLKLMDLWDSLVETGRSVLDIIMIVAGAGFILGTLQVTGLGSALTSMISGVGTGNLFYLLIISAILCIVLGMGMPTGAVYILLAILIAPSLVEVGVEPIAAHMFILYLGMMSLITPPVAVAAYFAASIAQAPAMATGWTSMRFGWTAYVVPFLFVFSPSLLLQGDNYWSLAIAVASAVGGVWLVSAGMMGYFTRAMDWATRVLFLVAGVLMLIPYEMADWAKWTDMAGLALGIVAMVKEYLARPQSPEATASTAAN